MDNKQTAITLYDLIKNGDIEKVKEIFNHDQGLLYFVTPFGTWLHVAARAGQLDMIKFLVHKGLDINVNEGVPKSAPIAQAAAEGEVSIVTYLLDIGAEIDVRDPNRNPLFSAIYGGHLEVVECLVQSGIDITVTYTGSTMQEMGAYEFAIERGETEIAEYLKQRIDDSHL